MRPQQLKAVEPVAVKTVLSGLPFIRSGLSKVPDSPEAWLLLLQQAGQRRWFQSARNAAPFIGQYLDSAISSVRKPRNGRGGEYVAHDVTVEYRPDWFLDKRIGGVCNHSSRAHIEKDQHQCPGLRSNTDQPSHPRTARSVFQKQLRRIHGNTLCKHLHQPGLSRKDDQ